MTNFCKKLYLPLMMAAVVSLTFSINAMAAEEPLPDGPSPAQTATAPSAQKTPSDSDDGLHFSVSPYIWFAGMHGTVGFGPVDASVHASFGQIFDYLNMGLMVSTEPRYKKFSAPTDFIWMKLSDDKASPLEVGPTSIKVKLNEDLLTQKVAYRLVGGKKLKIDGNAGIRYVHLGSTFTIYTTNIPAVSNYQAANWVDVVGGAKIQAALSPKAVVTIFGDAGAGGSNLDYQLGALLGYKLKHNMVLQGGWRYFAVDYRPSSTFVYDVTTSGVLIGLTINLK
jgi:hypothetical protein